MVSFGAHQNTRSFGGTQRNLQPLTLAESASSKLICKLDSTEHAKIKRVLASQEQCFGRDYAVRFTLRSTSFERIALCATTVRFVQILQRRKPSHLVGKRLLVSRFLLPCSIGFGQAIACIAFSIVFFDRVRPLL